MSDEPTNQPSMLSKLAAGVGLVTLALLIANYVFVAGGQSQVIQKHDVQIERLEQGQTNHASKEDIKRLETKIDMIINNELQKQRK